MESTLRIEAVVAFAAGSFIIGNSATNDQPFKLSSDLRRFKEITSGHAVLMGRRTAEAVGRALPNRLNLVLTRSGRVPYPGQIPVASPEEAIYRMLERARAERKAPTLFVIGGQEVYELMVPYLTGLHATEVNQRVSGDRFWPQLYCQRAIEAGVLGPAVTETEIHGEDAGVTYQYTYETIPSTPNNPLMALRSAVAELWERACADVTAPEALRIVDLIPTVGFAERFLALRQHVESMRRWNAPAGEGAQRWGFNDRPWTAGRHDSGRYSDNDGTRFGDRMSRRHPLAPLSPSYDPRYRSGVPATSSGEVQIEIRGLAAVGKTALLAWLGKQLDRRLIGMGRLIPITVYNREGDWPAMMERMTPEFEKSFDLPNVQSIVLIDADDRPVRMRTRNRGGYLGNLFPPEESDADLSVDQLVAKYGVANEHPKFSREDWKSAVAHGSTWLGYWDWVKNALSLVNELDEVPPSETPEA